MAVGAQFSRNIRKRGSQVENAGARAVRAVAKRALKTLVNMTPVDTGLTRSNWRVSLVNRTYSQIPAYVKYPKKRETSDRNSERANARAAIAAGNAVIERLRPGRGRSLAQALYITNNTEYLPYIHHGRFLSMVQSVIEGFIAEVSTIRIFVDSDEDDEEE
jgi:hypothetical protein